MEYDDCYTNFSATFLLVTFGTARSHTHVTSITRYTRVTACDSVAGVA